MSKRYENVSLINDTSLISSGFYQDYQISDTNILERLCKSLGVSFDLYTLLNRRSPESADNLIKALCKEYEKPEVVLIIGNDNLIVDYTFESSRHPILNTEFIKRARSAVEDQDHISLEEIYLEEESSIASVIYKKKDPIIVTEQYMTGNNKEIPYTIGVKIYNDETIGAWTRLVLYVNDHPLYLPSRLYSLSTARYKKSSTNTLDALNILLLTVIEDLREDNLLEKIKDLHYNIRGYEDIKLSYEEYNSTLRILRKIPSMIEDPSLLDELVMKYESFEKKYPHIDDKKNSYLYRCTAINDFSLGYLIYTITSILNIQQAPPIEYEDIRDLLGTYISTPRIITEIAKEG